MSTTKINSVIETIEIVKCTSGFIVYLHDGRGEVVATRAISDLGYSGYFGADSVIGAIHEAFKVVKE